VGFIVRWEHCPTRPASGVRLLLERGVPGGATPLLITHGGLDETATPDHSNAFVEAMQKAGKPVIYLSAVGSSQSETISTMSPSRSRPVRI